MYMLTETNDNGGKGRRLLQDVYTREKQLLGIQEIRGLKWGEGICSKGDYFWKLVVHQIQTKSPFNSQVWGFLRLAPITQLELFGEHDFTASEKAE